MFTLAPNILTYTLLQLLVQLLEAESFVPLQTLIEELIQNPDQNKQRGAAEFLAGLLNGKIFVFCEPQASQGT